MDNMQLYARWFAARGPLRMSTRKAGETIFAIVSPDVGRLLCDELGWTQKQHARVGRRHTLSSLASRLIHRRAHVPATSLAHAAD